MNKIILIVLVGLLGAGTALAQLTVGQPAKDFSLEDTSGQKRSLSEFHGKYVVLEWFNYECPFVKKHYDSGHMQALQKEFAAQGVVWLAINSSAPGNQGHYSAKEMNDLTRAKGGAAAAVLLDPSGKVGRLYGAQTTPHMFIIDPQGNLIYQGAIDDKPGVDPSELKGAKNYVRAALQEALAGRPVEVSSTKPYGCSVKY